MNIKQIENKIRRAVKRAQKNGFKIIAGDFGVHVFQRFTNDYTQFRVVPRSVSGKCICPIGALILGKDVDAKIAEDLCINKAIVVASSLLGKKLDWVSSFVDGFDGCTHLKNASYTVPSAYNLGTKFRKETFKTA